jgi:hypothetical protein
MTNNIDLASPSTGSNTRGRTPIWRMEVNGAEFDAEVVEVLLASLLDPHHQRRQRRPRPCPNQASAFAD